MRPRARVASQPVSRWCRVDRRLKMQNASLVLAFAFWSGVRLFGKVAPIEALSGASPLPHLTAFTLQLWEGACPR